jgi:dihydroorotate dehydrogenase (NAD+) catalytic subunit
VGSLIVSDPAEAARRAKEMEAAGLRWIELNVGAPHAREAAEGAIRTAEEPVAIGELVRPVRDAVALPLTVKLGSQGDVLALIEAANDAGADAVCVAGRHLAFVPDLATRRPILGTFGAIGGTWALPLTLRWIAKARQRFGPDLDVIGTNGARDGLDVARFLLAGARAVEMTSAVITDGPSALRRAVDELDRYLRRQATTVERIVGEAADHALAYEDATSERAGTGGATKERGA